MLAVQLVTCENELKKNSENLLKIKESLHLIETNRFVQEGPDSKLQESLMLDFRNDVGVALTFIIDAYKECVDNENGDFSYLVSSIRNVMKARGLK